MGKLFTWISCHPKPCIWYWYMGTNLLIWALIYICEYFHVRTLPSPNVHFSKSHTDQLRVDLSKSSWVFLYFLNSVYQPECRILVFFLGDAWGVLRIWVGVSNSMQQHWSWKWLASLKYKQISRDKKWREDRETPGNWASHSSDSLPAAWLH